MVWISGPVAYTFEILMIIEVRHLWQSVCKLMLLLLVRRSEFEWSQFVENGPSYVNVKSTEHTCGAMGLKRGSPLVSGTAYFRTAFQHQSQHLGGEYHSLALSLRSCV